MEKKLQNMNANEVSTTNVGIIAPCPPPHGGITRMIQNNLDNWGCDIKTFLIPNYPPVAPMPLSMSKASDGRRGSVLFRC